MQARRVLRMAVLATALFAAAAAAQVPPQPAEAVGYSLDPGHTFVHWEVQHMGTSTTRGRFDRASGNVQFDAKTQRIDIGITIDTASVSTGLPAFDTVMRGAPLLAASAHPQAFFTASRARWEGEVPREIFGEITLRGVSKALALRAMRWKCGLNLLFQREVCGGDFEATLKRSDFGMTLALPLVADDIRLLLQVEAVRGAAPP